MKARKIATKNKERKVLPCVRNQEAIYILQFIIIKSTFGDIALVFFHTMHILNHYPVIIKTVFWPALSACFIFLYLAGFSPYKYLLLSWRIILQTLTITKSAFMNELV